MTQAGIEPATFRFVAQSLNHFATMIEVFFITFIKLLVSVQQVLEWGLTRWDLGLYVLYL